MAQNPFDNAGPMIDGWSKDEEPQQATVKTLAMADMEAFDSLGPLTRQVLCGTCVKFSALNLARLLAKRWPDCKPHHINVDRVAAGWVRREDPKIMALITVSDADNLRLLDEQSESA